MKMKKLADIPKENIYRVPEDYFEKLPSVVQSRITAQHTSSKPRLYFSFALKYALPVLLIGIAISVWLYPGSPQQKDAETILASIETEHLIDYLAETDLTFDELMKASDLTQTDAADIESEVYDLQFTDEALEEYINDVEFDLKN